MKLLQKLNSDRFRRLTTESTWIVLGQFIAVLGALAGIRILTEFMDPELYGQLALGLTLASLVSQAFMGPISAGSSRFFGAASEAAELKPYLRAIRRLTSNLTIALIFLTSISIAGLTFFEYKSWILLIIASIGFALFTGYNNIFNALQNAARNRKIVALHSGVTPWARILIAVILIYIFGVSATVVIMGYVIATVIILTSHFFYFQPILKIAKTQVSTQNNTVDFWQARIINYSWPFATWGIFVALHLASDKWALATFSSSENVGFYTVLFQIGYFPVAIFTEMLVSVVSPIIFQRAGDASSQQRVLNATRLNVLIVGIVLTVTSITFMIAWAGHAIIFDFLAAKQYAKVSYLLPWFTLSAGIVAAAHVLSLARMSILQTKGLITPKIVTAILGLLLNFWGAYLYGLEGVVFAQLIFAIIYFVWMFFQYIIFSKKLVNGNQQHQI